MATAAVRRYWSRVAALGCIICDAPAQIAHCHGGSIVERMQEPKAKGKKLPRLDYLVLPLCPFHHSLLDNGGAEIFESRYVTQAEYIDAFCVLFSMDLWKLASEGRKSSPDTGGNSR